MFLVFTLLVGEKAHGGAESAPRRVVNDVGFEDGLVAAGGVDEMVPRRRIVEAAGADVARIAVVIDLADAGAVIAIVLEHLRQRHHVRHAGAEVVGQVEDARRARPQAGQ